MKRFIIILLALVLIPSLASAQSIVNCGNTAGNECTLPHLVGLFIRLINFFIGAAWIIATFFIFWGAYGMAMSYGNTEKIEGGKKTIQNAFIGFFLVMIAFLLTNFIILALTGMSVEELLEFIPLP